MSRLTSISEIRALVKAGQYEWCSREEAGDTGIFDSNADGSNARFAKLVEGSHCDMLNCNLKFADKCFTDSQAAKGKLQDELDAKTTKILRLTKAWAKEERKLRNIAGVGLRQAVRDRLRADLLHRVREEVLATLEGDETDD